MYQIHCLKYSKHWGFSIHWGIHSEINNILGIETRILILCWEISILKI